MSREQWGHGFYKGIEAAAKLPNSPKYLVQTDSKGYPVHFFIIREKHDDIYTLELYDEPITNIQLAGLILDFDEDEIEPFEYYELNINDIGKHKLFYSKHAALGFLARRWHHYIENEISKDDPEYYALLTKGRYVKQGGLSDDS